MLNRYAFAVLSILPRSTVTVTCCGAPTATLVRTTVGPEIVPGDDVLSPRKPVPLKVSVTVLAVLLPLVVLTPLLVTVSLIVPTLPLRVLLVTVRSIVAWFETLANAGTDVAICTAGTTQAACAAVRSTARRLGARCGEVV